MRVLYIHAKEFSYKPREKVKIKAVEDDKGPHSFSNTLVVFLTVEVGDFEHRKDVIPVFIDDLLKIYRKVSAKNIVIYPFAHLSSTLEEPVKALKVLKLLDVELNKRNVKYHRAPFGWYKEFKIHCLGHPLAELSRSF